MVCDQLKLTFCTKAYGLYGTASTGGKQSDPYKTAVIDTLVAEIQSVPGEDRCVLMCGYEPQMREMFQVRAITYKRLSVKLTKTDLLERQPWSLAPLRDRGRLPL